MPYIKSLELQGFKSFATKTLLKFPKAFNMVIGANGSGKSNVIDALCFVLGKSSKKSMRAEKFSHLIFNGGKKDKPAKNAVVKIVFDNSKKVFPYNTGEVIISRSVKKDGVSTYKINSNIVKKQEVLNALNAVGLNPDGYNIILQGDIDKFIDLSSENRRQVIEEISGISVYEDKKRRSLNELSKVESKIKEAKILLTEREKYLKELMNEKKQAENYLRMQEEFRYKKGSLLFKKIADCKLKVDEYDSKIKMINEKIEACQAETTNSQQEINKLKADSAAVKKKLELQGEEERRKLSKELEELRVEEGRLSNTIENHDKEIKRLTKRREDVSKELEDVLDEINKHKAVIKEINANVEKKKSMLAEKNKEYNLSDEVDYLKSRHELQELGSRILKKKEMLVKCSQAKDRLKEFESVAEKLTAEEGMLTRVLAELNERTKEHQAAVNKLSEVKDYLEHLNSEKLTIEAKISASIGNYSRGVNELLKIKHQLKGVHGTIRELGLADEKHMLALEVAAGSRMNSIITDDDLIAEQCINHLRNNKLGIASFIPLNKARPQPLNNFKRDLGVVDLAVNLIKYDKKYEKAFQLVFGSTLIVHDLKTARKVDYKGRIVTLEGDLVDSQGMMTGGYRSRANTKSLISNYNEKLNELITKLRKYKRYESELTEAGSVTSEELIKLRELKAKHESLISELSKKKEELNFEKKEAGKYDELVNEIKELELKAKELESRLGDPIDEEKIRSVKRDTKLITEELNKLEVDRRTATAELNNILLKESANLEKLLSGFEKEKKDFLAELKEVKQRIKEVRKSIGLKEKEELKLNNQLKKLLDDKEKLSKTIESKDKKIVDLKEKAYSLKEKTQSINLEKASFSAKLEGLNQAFNEFKDLNIEQVRDSVKILSEKISKLESRLKNYGPVNMKALEAFKEAKENYDEVKVKSDKLENEKDKIMNVIEQIEGRKQEAFVKTFSEVNSNFGRIFSNLSPGGVAKLELENKEDPFSGGVFVYARPRGKKILTLKSMSGGEKTITALAFIFSIQEYNPAPFYIMDEVDAALDKANSEMLSKLLKNYSSSAQFIVISHNDDMISEADYLFGVSMDPNGKSNITSIKLPEE